MKGSVIIDIFSEEPSFQIETINLLSSIYKDSPVEEQIKIREKLFTEQMWSVSLSGLMCLHVIVFAITFTYSDFCLALCVGTWAVAVYHLVYFVQRLMRYCALVRILK